MSKGKRSDSSTRLRQILDAAQAILTSGGVESVRTATLSELVGLSEAAIYRHVRSKEEILSLVVDDVRSTIFKGIDAASTPPDKPALRKLEHILQHHLSWMDGRHGVCLVLVTASLQFGDSEAATRARKLIKDYGDRIAEIVEDGIRRGEIDPTLNTEAAATMFLGLERAAVNRWLQYPDEKRPRCRADELWRMYRSSVVVQREPAASGRLT